MGDDAKWYVPVQIEKWISDDPQPGIVQCKLIDASGGEWLFVEKQAIVTDVFLWSDSDYPQPGFVACELISETSDASGRVIAEIDTDKPWSVEAMDGTTRFRVFRDQLIIREH